MNPQEAFLDMLVAAMMDAAVEKKLSQIVTQLDPSGTGSGPLKKVRIIIVPEEQQYSWPSHAPLGSVGQG